jgi:hypothetical protein
MFTLGHQPILKIRFESGREACRYLLRNSRTQDGHALPMTPAELVPKLQCEGFFVTTLDAEALLRELAVDGEAMEIDSDAGYRWIDQNRAA